MKRIRLGVIGLGLIWIREHRPSLERLRDFFELVAFCDTNEQRRTETAQMFPGLPVLEDYRQLLTMPDVETVLVLTPIAFNAPIALAALQADKDVIMEKPIARSVLEGQHLIEVAHRKGRRLFVTEQLAYRRADQILADVLASGEIGEMVLWERVQHFEADTAQGPLSYASTSWRRHADFPLGTLFDGGIHLIASLGSTFGTPQTVFALGRKIRPEYGEYDQVAMMFEYSSGTTGMLSHSSCLPTTQNHFHIHGSEGIIVVESNRLVVEKSGGVEHVIDLPADDHRNRMWQAIVTAYRQGSETPYPPQRALGDVAILEAVDQSIKSGMKRGIAVPL